ncbi:MAG: hypothetical protein HQ503_14630 [Rhodospirillales bacterium]|nr:hypothetical protein [Rhodospirillales bacterium]
MDILDSLVKWIAQITQVVVVLVPLTVVVGVLFGSQVPFFGNVVGNLMDLLKSFADNGLIGLIAIGIIAWLFGKVYNS